MVAHLNEYWNPQWSVWRKSQLLWARPCEAGPCWGLCQKLVEIYHHEDNDIK